MDFIISKEKGGCEFGGEQRQVYVSLEAENERKRFLSAFPKEIESLS